MDLNGISQLIGSLGFPIVCVIALAWFGYTVYQNFMKQSDAREERLYKLVNKCQAQLATAQEVNEGFVEVLKDYKVDLQSIKNDIEDIKEKLQ